LLLLLQVGNNDVDDAKTGYQILMQSVGATVTAVVNNTHRKLAFCLYQQLLSSLWSIVAKTDKTI